MKEEKIKKETAEKQNSPAENNQTEKKAKPSAEVEELKSKLAEAEKKAEEFKDKWMRNVAEFDNYKKRNAKLWQDAFAEGRADVIVKILSIGDNLDWALNMGLDEKTAEGIKKTKQKFTETLQGIGVTEINPEGEVFDPNIAEAVMQAEAGEGEESDRVKQVFQRGYKMGDKVIRYAKVSVIK